MRQLAREPTVLVTLLVVVVLMAIFIIYPQVRVVLVPGVEGYSDFFRGQTWVKPLRNSLQVMVLSTTTAVLLASSMLTQWSTARCPGSRSSA